MKSASVEAQRRIKYIEQTQAEVIETLAMDEVVKQVGEFNTSPLLIAAKSLYIADIRGGVASIPVEYIDTDIIPIVALAPGEEVICDATLAPMSPEQERSLAKKIELWRGCGRTAITADEIIDGINAALISKNLLEGGTRLAAEERERGFCKCHWVECELDKEDFTNLGNNSSRIFRGRPVVGLIMRDDPQNSRSVTLVHELAHNLQNTNNPVEMCGKQKLADGRVRRELKANHIGAHYGVALYYSDDERFRGDSALTTNWEVEEIRYMHAGGRDPFYPNRPAKKALEEAGLYTLEDLKAA